MKLNLHATIRPPTFNQALLYVRWLNLKRLARRRLAGEGLAALAEAMSALNRFAKSQRNIYGIGAGAFYSYKTLVIRELYRADHCRKVEIVAQDLKCRSCNGTGMYYSSQDCYRCLGTGVYRIVLLFQFHFDFGGRTFIWHQPERMVDYLTVDEVTGGDRDRVGRYADSKPMEPDPLTRERRDSLLAVLHVFLESRGQRKTMLQPCAISLAMALRLDWHSSRLAKAMRNAQQALRRLRILIRLVRDGRPLPDDLEFSDFLDDEYIPF